MDEMVNIAKQYSEAVMKITELMRILTTPKRRIKMDDIKIVFPDGQEFKLPDISYEKFTELMFKEGSSDVEYNSYLRDNDMSILTDFNAESTAEIRLVVDNKGRGRQLIFKCIYDSDNSTIHNNPACGYNDGPPM